jgi:putative DNA methylase
VSDVTNQKNIQLVFPLSSEGKRNASTTDFQYLAQGIEARGHSPVYKMHKYFARRPHNVFRNLVEFYTNPGDVILDCFGGGGVTLVESLAVDRKSIYCDSNPLAAFIARCQISRVSISAYKRAIGKIRQQLAELCTQSFTTTCRKCEESAHVRWNEFTYLVSCPECRKTTNLSNLNKAEEDGEQINGTYRCEHCKESYRAVDVERNGETLVSVRVKCDLCGFHESVEPTQRDFDNHQHFCNSFESLVKKHNLWTPNDEIPANWDRQKEDCLHRKGFKKFSDFFTKRNLFFTSLFLDLVKRQKKEVDPALYELLLFTFSATLRFTNNLTFSTANWMGGRPVAWAKHAFWIPNQFVEVNPLEYLDKRAKAIESGMKFGQHSIPNCIEGKSIDDLLAKDATHIVWNGSSEKLGLPDESVDLVLTDPPYGSTESYVVFGWYGSGKNSG